MSWWNKTKDIGESRIDVASQRIDILAKSIETLWTFSWDIDKAIELLDMRLKKLEQLTKKEQK